MRTTAVKYPTLSFLQKTQCNTFSLRKRRLVESHDGVLLSCFLFLAVFLYTTSLFGLNPRDLTSNNS